MSLQHPENFSNSLNRSTDIIDFLDEAEMKLDELCERADRLQKKAASRQLQKRELENHLDETHHWLRTQEQRLERMLDTGEVKLHLAKMDAKDQITRVIKLVDQVRNHTNRTKHNMDLKMSNVLKNISDSCLNLRQTLAGNH